MPKPSEYLIANGWRPTRPEAHPRETMWRLNGAEMSFIDAVIEQDRIDRAKWAEKAQAPK